MRLCQRCILPETYPGIEFDENGICNYCLRWKPVQVFGEAELERVLSQYRGKGEKYDCIAPISGGRDSAFVLHQMVTKYNMRVHALTIDSGFILPEGLRNIERMVEILNVPHVWIRDNKQIQTAQRNCRIKFQGWLKYPSINTIVPVTNSGDKLMNLRMAKWAKQNRIPLILGGNAVGNSNFERSQFKFGYMGVFQREEGLFSTYDTMRLLFKLALEYVRAPYNYRLPIMREYLEGAAVFFFVSLFKPRGIDFLGFYDYIYWREKEIESTVMNELDWQKPPDATTSWRIDDSAYPLINYLYYRLVGFTEHDEMYSKMIREGQMSRDEALRRCQADHESDWIHGPRLTHILENELGVTKEQVDVVLDKYRDKLLKKLQKSRK